MEESLSVITEAAVKTSQAGRRYLVRCCQVQSDTVRYSE